MRPKNYRLEDLDLHPFALSSLLGRGYKRINDLRSLSRTEILMLPNVSGLSYQKLMVALNKEPYAQARRKPSDRSD